jgi:hypothetical protein
MREITEMMDTRTGLIWMRQVKAELIFSQAQDYARKVAKQTGQAWRVPTLGELQTFPFCESESQTFWSSDPVKGLPEYRNCLCTGSGVSWVHYGLAYYRLYAVRLVRTAYQVTPR